MPKYHVHYVQTVSTTVTVEADDPIEAIDKSYDYSEMQLDSITHGAFGGGSVDSAGEWEAVEVSDDNGNTVWTGL